jgi:hypothetical protein
MDFRKELAKELGLGAIAENTMLDDYVKACEAIAVRYHESEVKKFRLGAVIESLPQDKFCKVCNLPTDGEKCYSKRCPI